MMEYVDMKPIMKYILIGMISTFIAVYSYHYIRFRNKPSALRESHMHKRLQLLSSAAFSLGHGGADSQKVMGIICAALLVYGNTARKEGKENEISKDFQITEILQVEYKNPEGKLKKFKPEVAVIDNKLYYADHDRVFDAKRNCEIYTEKGKKTSQWNPNYPSKKVIEKGLESLQVYSFGDSIYDASTKEVIFKGKTLMRDYPKNGVFASMVDSKFHLLSDYKLKTKVHSETMPNWIAFGCYLMIGLGTLFGGWKIVKTMGTKITKVTPLEGVCAETAGALTLFTVSNFGIPVSTTHTITGSIIGVGATKRLSAVRWGVTINLLWAWILTIPVSAALAGLIYIILYFCK